MINKFTVHAVRKIVLVIFLPLLLAAIPTPSRSQFFWLGFQAGEGITWFSSPGNDNTRLSAGSGTSFGVFIRYGTRPYYQGGVEWLFSTNQMKFEVKPGHSAHDNVPFHNFKAPVIIGYEIIHKPRFKLRAGGGMFIGTNIVVSSNTFGLSRNDLRNPQVGMIGEAGIQYLNFLVLVDYDYSLSKFFSKDASTYGYNVRSHLQTFALKVGMQF